MTPEGSQVCSLLVVHRELDSQEAPVEFLSRMIWMIVTFHVLSLWMMLILLISNPGTCLLFTLHTVLSFNLSTVVSHQITLCLLTYFNNGTAICTLISNYIVTCILC